MAWSRVFCVHSDEGTICIDDGKIGQFGLVESIEENRYILGDRGFEYRRGFFHHRPNWEAIAVFSRCEQTEEIAIAQPTDKFGRIGAFNNQNTTAIGF